jgi:hypothetical protein
VRNRSHSLFETRFWQKAYESLPPSARREHAFHMHSAERWELRLDAAIELWSRASAALGTALHRPKPT